MDDEQVEVSGDGQQQQQNTVAGLSEGGYIVAELYSREGEYPVQFVRVDNAAVENVVSGAITHAISSREAATSSDETPLDYSSHLQVIITLNVVIMLSVFACVGALVVRTLIKSLEG